MQIAQLIGGAGTGKTAALMECMEKAVDQLHDPLLVGFCSFTRAACDEAADRAADKFNMRRQELRDSGWFKTLHGIAYRALGVGKELLTDNKESTTWIKEELQDAADGKPSDAADESLDVFEGARSDADRALALWGTARNKLVPLRTVWESAEECDTRTPDYGRCREIVERYEQAKRLDGRVDFTDIVGRFAGWSFHPDGAERCEPDGEAPQLPVWIQDEAQDSSMLLDSAWRRLIEQDGVRYVYFGLDPFQSIFGFGGSDPHCSQNYPLAKRRVMPKSHRCQAAILRLGEEILSDCTDYWDRGIQPAGPGGELEECDWTSGWQEMLDPRDSWLLLARTNFQAARMAKRLNEACIPWLGIGKKGGSPWRAPVRSMVVGALMSLAGGAWVNGKEWQAIVAKIPQKIGGEKLLQRGLQTDMARLEPEQAMQLGENIYPADLLELGATPRLLDMIANGGWKDLVDGAAEYVEAVERWGCEAVAEPRIRLGTIHSSKGLEADSVMLSTTVSAPCYHSAQSDEGADENRRLQYVACTRAKSKLVVLRERHAKFRWGLPI